jgi:hypothetical protein
MPLDKIKNFVRSIYHPVFEYKKGFKEFKTLEVLKTDLNSKDDFFPVKKPPIMGKTFLSC